MKVQLHFTRKFDKPDHVMVLLESPGEIRRFNEIIGGKNLNLATLLGQLMNDPEFTREIIEE